MITLLPETGRSRLRREYRLRLASLAAVMSAGAFVLGAVALLPSYVAAGVSGAALREEAEALSGALANSSLKSAGESVRSSQALLAAVERTIEVPRASQIVTSLAQARPAEVTVTRIEYSVTEASIAVRFSGVARTRSALLSFRTAVEKVPGVSGTDLPIENLTKASDITFALSVTMNRENLTL